MIYVKNKSSSLLGSIKRCRIKGFTLLEALLALFLSGILLTSAIAIIFNFNRIWAENEGEAGFSDHVMGAEVLLSALFRNRNSMVKGEADFELAHPPGFERFKDPLLRLYVNDPPPFFNSSEPANFPIVVYLYPKEEEGVFLLWHQFNPEIEDKSDLNKSLLSIFYESTLFLYYDTAFEKWEEEISPREETNNKGERIYVLPRAIKLSFRNEEEEKAFVLLIPSSGTGAPIP